MRTKAVTWCDYAGDEICDRNGEILPTRLMRWRNNWKPRSLLPRDDKIPGIVTASFGLYGGKRTEEREDVHYNATLDNLINLASKACTTAKYNKFEAQVEAQILQHEHAD